MRGVQFLYSIEKLAVMSKEGVLPCQAAFLCGGIDFYGCGLVWS